MFAPTLSGRPIFIRPGKSANDEIESGQSINRQESDTQRSRETEKSDEWKDLLDDDCTEKESDSTGTKTPVGERKKNSDSCNEKERREFANAVQSFWPNGNVKLGNVARSVRRIKNFNAEGTSSGDNIEKESKVELEVSIAVCPDFEHDQNRDSNGDSSMSRSKKPLLEDEQAARLQLVRIVNDVPIIENAEAHSCGLVHGIANKSVWGSFGLDIERTATATQDTSPSVPSFRLRDSNLVAPFINKNANHKLLEQDNDETQNRKRRRRGASASNDLSLANLRIGVILVVVHVRANPSALPLPTLSKVRYGG